MAQILAKIERARDAFRFSTPDVRKMKSGPSWNLNASRGVSILGHFGLASIYVFEKVTKTILDMTFFGRVIGLFGRKYQSFWSYNGHFGLTTFIQRSLWKKTVIFVHKILVSKCITSIKVNAIVDDHGFKTTAMLLFKKTMLLLTNIANQNPELLKNIPEFLCQNINDVTGLLRWVKLRGWCLRVHSADNIALKNDGD